MNRDQPFKTKYTETFNVEILENPHRGQSIVFLLTFDNKEQADAIKKAGRLGLTRKHRGIMGHMWLIPHGGTELDKCSVLPYVGIQKGTRRRPGKEWTDFRFSAFKNIETRCLLDDDQHPTPIQTSVPFTEYKTPSKVVTKPVKTTKTDIKQVIGLHVNKLPVARPAIHLVINNCKVSGTAEDVAELLLRM